MQLVPCWGLGELGALRCAVQSVVFKCVVSLQQGNGRFTDECPVENWPSLKDVMVQLTEGAGAASIGHVRSGCSGAGLWPT
jgi:hypothetical protein